MESITLAAPTTKTWVPHLPSWTRPDGRDVSEFDTAFAAGIALKSLDDLIRAETRMLTRRSRTMTTSFVKEPVSRETLARVVGKDCSIDLLIGDLMKELRDRPYELVPIAGCQHRTRPCFAETVLVSSAPTRGGAAALSEFEATVLMAVGYFQPVTRGELSKIFGKEVSRDTIAALRGAGFIGSGPHSPTPGAPYTYVTTPHFRSTFGRRRCATCRIWKRSRTPAC